MRTRILTSILALSLTSSLAAAEFFNFGRHWLALTTQAREIYVAGVVDGVSYAYFEAAESWLPSNEIYANPPSEKVERVRKKVFPMLADEALVAVMTDLYKDPANGFIDRRSLLFLARDKLLGQKIDDALVEARKSAIDRQELNLRSR
jgi:hypothetical protein